MTPEEQEILEKARQAQKARLSGKAPPPTDTNVVAQGMRQTKRRKSVGERSRTADAAETALVAQPGESWRGDVTQEQMKQLRNYESPDVVIGPDAIAAEQASDTELYPDILSDSIRPSELKGMASNLEQEIDSLEMQIKGSAGVKLRASPAERSKQQLTIDELKRQIKEKRLQYKSVVDRIIEIESDIDLKSRPEPQDEPYVREREPVYPERGWEKAAEKAREAETGLKTLERFYPSSYEGFGVGQSEVDLPIEGGGVAKFGYSRTRDREDREDIGIPTPFGRMGVPGLSPRMDGGPIEFAGRVAGAGLDAMLGGDTSPQELQPEALPRQGGLMFAPRSAGNKLNLPKLEAEMSKRKRNILGAQQRIQELEASLEDTTFTVPRGETYGEIELLEDDIEQMDAELAQMMRIKQVTAPEMQKAEEAEMLQDEFGTQF